MFFIYLKGVYIKIIFDELHKLFDFCAGFELILILRGVMKTTIEKTLGIQ